MRDYNGSCRHVPKDVVASDAHVKLAHEAAQQGMVLLKNEGGILPLSKEKTTAAIGPLSDARATLIGNYQGQICPGTESDGKEIYGCVQTFLEALGNASAAKVTHAEGVPTVLSNSTDGFADAVAAAQAADQVLLFLGIDGTVEGEGKDRHSIGLPDGQLALAKAVFASCAETKKPVVVVLANGGQLAIDWLAVHAPAIVEAWYPGVYGGRAVANALYGDSNRWGKTPVTIYGAGVLDELDMLDFEMGGPGVGRSYRYYTGKHLLYPMGYGLSYTTFAIKDAAAAAAPTGTATGQVLQVGKNTTVKIHVENTGNRAGDEVVMAMFVPHAGTVPAGAPAARLRQQMFAFERVSAKAGETVELAFVVTPEMLELFAANGDQMTYPGQ